ncbi:hypothetical protein, partial [uncultured Clostridium sp.]|uniref:hypothetical protein n=1 Tax=uncultured Clostridium sp. TaxID=59620 RepID=UPI0025E50E31
MKLKRALSILLITVFSIVFIACGKVTDSRSQDIPKDGIVKSKVFEDLMFDDDMTYGYHDFGFGCACENHMKYTCELLGEDISREELKQRVLCGGASKYRTAWQKSKGHYLELFAKDMRKAVDSVNPNIRLGACACMPNWGFDGLDFATLANVFAGNTKPYMRLTGA